MNRRSVFELFGGLGISPILLRGTRCFPAIWLTVLAYHRVCEYDPASPWDSDLISATPELFREQLQFVSRHFTPITSEQIVLWKKGRFTMPRNPIVLTFDDGYLDNFSVALPLLKGMGVVADFFVCPWNIDNGCLFWWDKIACCLKRSRSESVILTYPRRVELDLTSEEPREASRRKMLGIVKHTEHLDIQRLVDELQQSVGVEVDEREEAEKLLMGWGQICELRRAGMGIGSHSYSHPILPLISDETALEEMTRSKTAIEKQLNERIFALAYPTGRFHERTKALAQRAGYELAYSYCSGASLLRSTDLFNIRRVAVERYMSLPYFRTMVAVPLLTR